MNQIQEFVHKLILLSTTMCGLVYTESFGNLVLVECVVFATALMSLAFKSNVFRAFIIHKGEKSRVAWFQ